MENLQDVDFAKIASNLSYVDVLQLCRSSREVSKRCKDQYVWRVWLRYQTNKKLERIYKDIVETGKNIKLLTILLDDEELKTRIDLNKRLFKNEWRQKRNAILSAAERGHLEVVKKLLNDPKQRVDLADRDNSAIQLASFNGHLAIVKELLKHYPRVDPGADDNVAIRAASMNGHSEVVKELLKHYPRVNPADDDLAIKWASERGHLAVVEELKKWYRLHKIKLPKIFW